MTPDILRRNLLALRARLTNSQTSQKLSLTSDSGRFTARTSTSMAEHASDEQELDMMASRLNASSQALSEIDDAIGRIDAGHFNECEECGGEIGFRRLGIQPWARLCVPCQRKHEEELS